MRMLTRFFAVVCILLVQGSARAAVSGNASITVDWSSIALGGVPAVASSYADPSDSYVTISSYTYGDIAPFTESLDYFYTYNGLPFEVSTGAGPVSATAGFASGTTYASVDIDSAGDGFSSAMAWNGTGYIYQAGASGQMSFAIDYQLDGAATVGAGSEFLGVTYEVYLYHWDVDLFSSTFESLYASNGGDYDAAYRQANNTAFIMDDYFLGTILNCSSAGACVADQSGTFTTSPLSFAVQSGTNYGLEVYIQVTGDAYSTVVPVPAAEWLFGSALLGCALMSRRRNWESTSEQ